MDLNSECNQWPEILKRGFSFSDLQTGRRIKSLFLLLGFDDWRKKRTWKSDRKTPETCHICMYIHKSEYKLKRIWHQSWWHKDYFCFWSRLASVGQIETHISRSGLFLEWAISRLKDKDFIPYRPNSMHQGKICWIVFIHSACSGSNIDLAQVQLEFWIASSTLAR